MPGTYEQHASANDHIPNEGGVAMSGVAGGYGASAAFVLVLFILLVIILRAGVFY